MAQDEAAWDRPLEQLRYAREILETYGQTLQETAGRLNAQFCEAVDLVYHCQGSVIVSGMGKAGVIAQKIVATLASTGSRSHYLHPAEAVHGDLGRVHRDDVVMLFSQSGETEEIVRLLTPLKELGVPLIAITAHSRSTLGQAADVLIELGELKEACSLQLAPSTSTMVMLALGDALALVTSRRRNFKAEDFARFHPGGSLGFKLSRVHENMRPLEQCRVTTRTRSVRQVFVGLSRPGRRTGAIIVVDEEGKLCGLFTDSDLARLFESRNDRALDKPIGTVMTPQPLCVDAQQNMSTAVALLAAHKISELPVVDAQGRPVGLIDVTDVVSLPSGNVAKDPIPVARTA